jgi:hypothetical protein
MNILDFVIGTGIVWGLSALLVIPIARALTRRKARQLRLSIGAAESATVASESQADEIDTGYYIMADVMVLGIAGLLLGLVFGWFFIGITWHAKSWPGLIAFIVASLVGFAIHG